jgi:oxygen-independent coproporphyrinogen-3 oxidase
MPHVYVHVPFCVRRCSYCDFSIAVRKTIPADQYVAAIATELAGAPAVGPLATVYLGGGTPSLLPPELIATVLRYVFDQTPLPRVSPDAMEVTLEANPEDVTPERAAAWRAAGVNRVSLGAQSFDDRVLRWMHRSHDGAGIAAAVRTLRAGGVDNVSLDLIFGLPETLPRDWAADLRAALALEPDHLSLYGLTVEPRTPLARWISRGAATAPLEQRYAEEYLLAHERLGASGFTFYEVSNAARPGKRSRHNAAYWSGRSYLGVGPAAHSYDGSTRRWNLSAWEAYRAAWLAGRSVVEAAETLSDAQRFLERVYLGLRTVEGIPGDWVAGHGAALAALRRAGWVEDQNGSIRCTPEGWLRLDLLVGPLTGSAVTS